MLSAPGSRSWCSGYPPTSRDETLAAEPVRATLLDPRRPARDLLEHLLDGIASCHLLYAEYADDDLDEEDDNLEDDRTELVDRSTERPDLVAELAQLWRTWADRVGVLDWTAMVKRYANDGLRPEQAEE